MYLRAVEIRNYLSISHAKLEGFGQLNSLIGRNNSGKSAVFGALWFLGRVMHGNSHGRDRSADLAAVLTGQNPELALEVNLVFEPRPEDRTEFINLIPDDAGVGTRKRLLDSPFFSSVGFSFRSPRGLPHLLHLRSTRIAADDGRVATVQEMSVEPVEERKGNPESTVKHLTAGSVPGAVPKYSYDWVDLRFRNRPNSRVRFLTHSLAQPEGEPERIFTWLQARLARFFAEAFFFRPVRHSLRRAQAKEAQFLTQNGENLAQVIGTILSHDRPRLEEIEAFVRAAIPEVGTLQAPLSGTEMEIGFRSPDRRYFTHLHDMGGGVEQLTMVAAVLMTTPATHTLFLEEPESHMHPGAQRYLLDRLTRGGRQAFLTTHSPILLNGSRGEVYRVQYENRRSSVSRIQNAGHLADALADIGARNSDVLLSDAVLFVEGPGDQAAVTAWAATLNLSLSEHNITVLPTGGGEHSDRHAPIRSDVLEGISAKAPVPHLFVIDNDGRSAESVAMLMGRLKERCHVLGRWEIENYMLSARALLAALEDKAAHDSTLKSRLSVATEDEVRQVIDRASADLYARTLLKRIRAEIPGLKGGFMDRDLVEQLLSEVDNPSLAERIAILLRGKFDRHMATLDLKGLIDAQRRQLDGGWGNPVRRLELAPGEEIVNAVFEHYGSTYKKPRDTERIARIMTRDEIAPELQELIHRAIQLAKQP